MNIGERHPNTYFTRSATNHDATTAGYHHMAEVTAKEESQTRRPASSRFITQTGEKFYHTTNKLSDCSRPTERLTDTTRNSAETTKLRDSIGSQAKNNIRRSQTTPGVNWTTTKTWTMSVSMNHRYTLNNSNMLRGWTSYL